MSFSNTSEYYFDCTSGVYYNDTNIQINFEYEFHTTEGEKVSFSLSQNGLDGTEKLQVGRFSVWGWGDVGYLGISDLHEVNLKLITDEFVLVVDDETSEEDTAEEDTVEEFVLVVDENVSDWSTATDVGNGWKHTEWFGFFFESPFTNEWKYHITLGWVYIPGNSFDDIWMYSDKFGWMWTKKDFFPYVYVRFVGWIYVEDDRYYDFNKQTYISLSQ